jgi:hypothetical protein
MTGTEPTYYGIRQMAAGGPKQSVPGEDHRRRSHSGRAMPSLVAMSLNSEGTEARPDTQGPSDEHNGIINPPL